MSDRNPSPFRHALSRSKSFLSSIKLPSKRKNTSPSSDDNAIIHQTVGGDTTSTNPNYTRRMRVIAPTELAENPLNLGENGWGAQSWTRARREARQKEELEELWSEMGSEGRRSGAEGQSQTRERVSDARVLLGQAQAVREPKEGQQESRSTRGSVDDGGERKSGSPAQYMRALPFRVSGPREMPLPSGSTRTPDAGAGASPIKAKEQRAKVSGPYLSSESGAEVEARLAARAKPLRTRVAGPRPNDVQGRSGTYTSQGVRVTPGSYGDREREEYLARIARGSSGSER